MKFLFLFLTGAFIYGMIEVLYKGGDTHLSMFIVGGMCFLLLGALGQKKPLLLRMAAGAVIITALEFISGLIVNIWLRLAVWDYSELPFNIMGQICLWATMMWFLLSFVGIQLYGLLKWKFFPIKITNSK
ncbi:MAG: putative ABC transporter permease [Oscillospiraceae bacterium]|nr:putative ABC transporter permease [Oscillospiraceae bacterium]